MHMDVSLKLLQEQLMKFLCTKQYQQKYFVLFLEAFIC